MFGCGAWHLARRQLSTAIGDRRGAKQTDEAADLAVGARLKVLREAAGISQRELAKRSGVTHATISLIEQESHAPSLVSLHRILQAFPVSLADFFALPISQTNVIFAEAQELTVVFRGETDIRMLAAERRDKRLQLFFEHYQPGAGTGEEPIIHQGETAAMVIQGTVEVEAGGLVRRIGPEGGFQVLNGEPYKLKNIGDEIAVVVCACTPPMI
ncbi:helix-turn-helix domain-containing protein [Mesorhizobium sp. M3A.F.Ca.ET.080.04.2.1]|nr:helix-turn-helix domain-containing protein [Mesorhizobium sp. M3A.F.Ca.ET.080.04.2.1]RWF16224.1 MAG: helix-turn-helix domain-containing protein [Mesorhizobium sp.]